MNTKVFIVSHKNLQLPKLVKGYYPLQVGLSRQNYHGYWRDNTGQNIASKNPNYCELTAMYWIWKNVHADVKGLVHYRRFFSDSCFNFTKQQEFKHIISIQRINTYLRHYDLILPKKRHYYIETMWSHYEHSHKIISLKVTRQILKEFYHGYLHSFDLVMRRRSAHMFNMLIARSKIFNDYAQWLFGVLNRLEDRLDISNWSKSEARVYGYVSELLLDVWLNHQANVRYKELPVDFIGSQHCVKKIISFIGRKFE